LRQQLELSDAARSLTDARASAIRAGVTAADNHDTSIACFVYSSEFLTFEPAILRRQKIHCEVHSLELATGNVEIPRLARSCRDADGIELHAQFFSGDVLANVDPRAELHSLRLELAKTKIEHRFLQLELRNSVAKQPANPLIPLEHRNRMSRSAQLLGGREARGP